MKPFAQFLIAMGYPEDRIRNPRDGAHSEKSFADSARIAGTLAWYYETEGLRPRMIGHSQGGMLAIRILYEHTRMPGFPLRIISPQTRMRAHGSTHMYRGQAQPYPIQAKSTRPTSSMPPTSGTA
jgi:hypothetical protein